MNVQKMIGTYVRLYLEIHRKKIHGVEGLIFRESWKDAEICYSLLIIIVFTV